jgi:hypothetical protein
MPKYYFHHPAGHTARIAAASEFEARSKLRELIANIPLAHWQSGTADEWPNLNLPWRLLKLSKPRTKAPL